MHISQIPSSGAWGDAVVFDLQQGEFQLGDAGGQTRIGKQNLEPIAVVKGGKIYRQGNF